MTANELFQTGKLDEAIEAVTDEIKAKPAATERRTLLFELLCFAGHLDRAEKQLDVIAKQDANAEWAVQVYQNILVAERARRRLFSDGLTPQFLRDPPAYVQLHLDAVNRQRDGRGADAAELLNRSEQQRPIISGEIDGQAVDEFRDCDDLFAPILELVILRDYIWLPLEHVREFELSAPERPRDLIWAPVRISLTDGSQRRGYLPTLYCGSHEQDDDQLKLGRLTDWLGMDEGPVRGVGQRLFLAGEDARSVLDMRRAVLRAEPGGRP
ncbi:MAG: type VI secretion system accessory protein TagJ [Pirellulaceae bacterium]